MNWRMPVIRSLSIAIGIVPFLGSAWAASPPPLTSPAPKSPPQIQAACTSDEKWNWNNTIPISFSKEFSKPVHGKSDALHLLQEAQKLKYLAKTLSQQNIGKYLVYRAYLELGLIHFAYFGFSRLIDKPFAPADQFLVLATVSCLTKIHQDHNSLSLSPILMGSLNSIKSNELTPADRLIYWQAIASIAGSKISRPADNVDISQEFALLSGSGAYQHLITALDASKKGNMAYSVPLLEKIIKQFSSNPAIAPQMEAIHLNLGRFYYQEGLYDKALTEFNQINQESNFLSAALLARSWSYLRQRKYSETVSSSMNFKVGELKDTFSPEADEILAMSYSENCRYKQALSALGYFKQKYKSTYKTLYDWYNRQKHSPLNYYDMAIAYLKGNRNSVPKPIVLEWLRSPRFIASQDELNLFIDENLKVDELLKTVNENYTKADRQVRFVLDLFKKDLYSWKQSNNSNRQKMINQINNELGWKNSSMMSNLIEVRENLQLIEIDSLRSMGDSALNKNMDTKTDKPSEVAKNSLIAPNSLDWGVIKPGAINEKGVEQESEVWDDEVGDITTDISNECKKK